MKKIDNEGKMLWKGVLGIVIAVIVIASFFYLTTPVDDVEQPGVPQLSIGLNMIKYDPVTLKQEDVANVEWEIRNNEDLPTPVSSKEFAFTVLEVGTPFVEPNSRYHLEFYVDVIVTPESPAVTTLDGIIRINGQIATGEWTYTNFFDDANTEVEVLGFPREVETAFDVTVANLKAFELLGKPPSDDQAPITGARIHDSTFTIAVNTFASNDPTIFGTLSQDIILKVGEGGSLNVQITDISVGVPAP